MAINFPANPNPDDVHEENNLKFIYDGTMWNLFITSFASPSDNSTTIVSPTDTVNIYDNININDVNYMITKTIVTNSTSPTLMLSFDSTIYRSGKFFIQTELGNVINSIEISILHDGTNINKLEYGTIAFGQILANFDAEFSGNDVLVKVIPETSDYMKHKIVGNLITI